MLCVKVGMFFGCFVQILVSDGLDVVREVLNVTQFLAVGQNWGGEHHGY